MIEVATASINSFASGKADFVQPSEQLITLTYGQLQDLVQETIERATTPLESRIESLERKVGSGEGREDALDGHKRQDNLHHIVQLLQAENGALKRELEAFQEHVAQERAFDRQRIVRLESRPAPTTPMAGTKTAARIDRIRAILKARGGTVSFKELQRELELKPNQFSALVARLDKRTFQVLINPLARDEKALRLRAFT
jgi:hypothetical protein